jgi:hypothetical protein
LGFVEQTAAGTKSLCSWNLAIANSHLCHFVGKCVASLHTFY